MMAMGDKYAVICLDCIEDENERKTVVDSLTGYGKKIIAISKAQMNAYAGNMLQLQTHSGNPILVMSESAFQSLNKTQIRILEGFNTLVHDSIETIQKYGGGSVRCMLAENFLHIK
jgi:hypothetical protein